MKTFYKTFYKTIEDLIKDESKCPIPISVFPNQMGINLVSVEGIGWQEQNDGQLVSLSVYFIPTEKAPEEKQN